jgi:hypothetical protein
VGDGIWSGNGSVFLLANADCCSTIGMLCVGTRKNLYIRSKMMGVANKFAASSINVDPVAKKVYLLGIVKERMLFEYDIYCKSQDVFMFFNMKAGTLLIAIRTIKWSPDSDTTPAKFSCASMSFWVENDKPVPAVKWLYQQDAEIDKIAEDFKFKYAAHLMDSIIQS